MSASLPECPTVVNPGTSRPSDRPWAARAHEAIAERLNASGKTLDDLATPAERERTFEVLREIACARREAHYRSRFVFVGCLVAAPLLAILAMGVRP